MITRCWMKTFCSPGQVWPSSSNWRPVPVRMRTPGIVARNRSGSSTRTSLAIAEPSSDQISIREGWTLAARTARTMYCTARVCTANEAGSIASALKTGAMTCWNRSNSPEGHQRGWISKTCRPACANKSWMPEA